MPFFKISLLKAILVKIHSESKQQVILLQLLQRNHLLACIPFYNLQTALKKRYGCGFELKRIAIWNPFQREKTKIWRMYTKGYDLGSCINLWKMLLCILWHQEPLCQSKIQWCYCVLNTDIPFLFTRFLWTMEGWFKTKITEYVSKEL